MGASKKTRVFIGLGSNMGDRSATLRKAGALLCLRAGKVLHQSPIYESPSWGYQSQPFYNACLLLETHLPPQNLLDCMQNIEKELGRQPKTRSGYEDRPLDLDLLFYGDLSIASPSLAVPHPQLHLRNFVLQPLVAIAPEYRHPVLQQSLETLLQESPDTAQLKQKYPASWVPQLFDSQKQFFVIEGNIGSGKTTLTQKLAAQFKVPALYENFSDNPHLPAFYENPEAHALEVETHFMEDRIEAYTNFFAKGKPPQGAVADYSFFKSLLFAELNLNSTDYQTYKNNFKAQTASLQAPDVVVYLHRPTTVLLAQIKARGRSYEQGISAEYLEQIAQQYEAFLAELSCPVVRLDLGAVDFVGEAAVYEQLLVSLMLL